MLLRYPSTLWSLLVSTKISSIPRVTAPLLGHELSNTRVLNIIFPVTPSGARIILFPSFIAFSMRI